MRPQATQWWSLAETRDRCSAPPQAGRVWLVQAGFTATLCRALLSSICLSRPQPWARLPRFKPLFCATFLPGFSTVPAAEAIIFCTFKSSSTTAVALPVMCRLL